MGEFSWLIEYGENLLRDIEHVVQHPRVGDYGVTWCPWRRVHMRVPVGAWTCPGCGEILRTEE